MSRERRPWLVAIDLDETIIDNGFPDISSAVLKPHVIESINKLHNEGCYIIIWTCRFLPGHVNDAKSLLRSNGIPFDEFNTNYPGLEFKPNPKIYYDTLIDDKCLMNIDWEYLPAYVNIMRYRNLDIVTTEMSDWYFKRTIQHIKDVKIFYKIICNHYGVDPSNTINNHDMDKFKIEYVNPYILIQWKYYCKARSIQFEIPDDFKDICDKITEKHITVSNHHPEFYELDKTNLVNKENRDAITKQIDATDMPINSIYEMLADWCSVSIDRGTSIKEWMEKNVNKRWMFTNSQTKVIEDTVEYLIKNHGIR
jgi:hydroxymethylpyrimidine pyrophosphatase-like HAD family hydrolase